MSGYYYRNGQRSLCLRSYNNGNIGSSMAVMPLLEESDLGGLTLRFHLLGGYYGCALSVGIMTDPDNPATFDTLATFPHYDWDNWSEYSVDLGALVDSGQWFIAFLYHADNYYSGDLYLDDLTLDRCHVGQVRAYSETTDGVTIAWMSSGTTDSVLIEYGPEGFTPGDTIFANEECGMRNEELMDTSANSSFLIPHSSLLTGLTPGTTYDYYVRPYCANSSQSCSEQRHQFATTPTRVGAGWCCDFESHNGSGSMPRHWRRAAGQDGWPCIYVHSDPRYYTSANSAFEFRAHDGGCNIAVMPYSEDTLSQLVLSFNMRLNPDSYNPERCTLVVGAMPDPYDTAAFVPIDTLHPGYPWQRHDVSLASYTGTFRHIAFKYLDSEYRITYLDDLRLMRCTPTAVSVTAVTDTSVTLSWQQLGYSDTTIVQYGLVGSDALSTLHSPLSTLHSPLSTLHSPLSTLTVTGLIPDTTYWFRLYGSCLVPEHPGCQAVTVTQRTLAEPMSIPLCVDFEDDLLTDGLPTGWLRPYGNAEACVITGDAGHNHTPHGGNALHLYAYSCDYAEYDRTNMVVMPQLATDLWPPTTDLWLEFHSMATNPQLKLVVGLISNPHDTATFVALDTVDATQGWLRHLIQLSSLNSPLSTLHSPLSTLHSPLSTLHSPLSTPRIAFKSLATYCSMGDIYVDDITLRSCAIITAYAGMPTDSSLTLSWTASSGTEGVWVEYKQVGGAGQDFLPGTGDTIFINEECGMRNEELSGCDSNNSSFLIPHSSLKNDSSFLIPHSSFYTISTLNQATWYAFHLYPDCGDGSDGCDYVLAIAQTLHPGVDIPYCESFDSYASGNYPGDWRRLSTYGDDWPHIQSGNNRSADNALHLLAQGAAHSLAVMPRLNVGPACPLVDSLYANFWTCFESNWEQSALIVGIVTDANSAASFQPVDTLRATAYGLWEHHTVALRNLSTADTYVAYKFVSLDGNPSSLLLDDLCMEKCVAADVTVSDITQNSVTVSWQSFGVDSLVCEYGPAGFAAGTGNIVVLHSSPSVIDGLDDGTRYQFTFASVCGCQQYGATYSPGGGSNGGAGCRWCGSCWGWYWDDTGQRWRWCWGQWQGHPWDWTPQGNYYPPFVDSVVTQAACLQLPYCEGFEDYDTVGFPRSWRRIAASATTAYPAITHTNSHSGNHSLLFYTIPGQSSYAALAPLPDSAGGHVLTFFAYANNGNAVGDNARFIVGAMTDPDNPATFQPVDTVRLTATGQWQQCVVDLSAYTGSGHYVAFRFAPFNDSYFYYIDDLYLGTCAISNLHLVTTATSVSLAWTAHGSPSQVMVEYGPQGFTPGDTSSLGTFILDSPSENDSSSLTPNSSLLPGLSPDDNYDLYATALCNGATAGCFNSPVTLNPKLYTPYCEDFEDIPDGTMPERWKVVASQSGYPLTETQHGQQVVAFYPCYYQDNTVLLPPLPDGDTLEGKWLYADFSTYSSNYIFLDFGCLTDTNNPSSFVQMGSMSNGAYEQLREFNIQLHSTAAVGNRLAIRARSTSGCRWLRLAKMVFSNSPYPLGVTSTPLGVASRRLQWDNSNENAHYGIEYGHGDQWQTIALSDSCSAILTGLQPGITYQVYFVSPDGERFCLPYTFTNDEYTNLPLCEDFDSQGYLAVPTGWQSYSSYGDSYPRTYYSAYNSCCQTLDFYCNNSNLQYTAKPDFGVDGQPVPINNISLSFNLRIEDVGNTSLVVGVMDDRGDFGTFTPVDTMTCPTSGTYYHKNISLASYTGTGRYVAFLIQTNYSWRTSLFIDDLNVSPCATPEITVAGARQVKVTNGAGSWVEYDTVGFESGTGTVVHVTEDPFYITGLQPNTQYAFHARCDSLTLSCAAPTMLTTTFELEVPYCNDFDADGYVSVPDYWQSYSSYGDNYPRTYYSCYNSCCQTLDFYCNNSHLQYAVMPDMDVDDISRLHLYFMLRIEYIEHTRLLVGVMDDPNDYNTFSVIDTLTCPTSSTYYSKHVSLSSYTGNGRFIAFRILTDDGSRRPLYLDDLYVDDHSSPHINLFDATTVRVVSLVGSGELVVNSTGEQALTTDYWIEMAPQDTAQGSDANIWFHVTQDTFCITGLDEMTTYDFYHHSDSGTVTCFPPTRITTSMVLGAPVCDRFDQYGNYSLPTGWTSWSNSYNNHVYTNNSGQLEFYNSYYNNNLTYAITPDLGDSPSGVAGYEVYFSMSTYNYLQNCMLLVGVMNDPNDIGTFVVMDTLRNSATGTWERQHVSLRDYHGDGHFLAFCLAMSSTGYPYLYIDSLFIQACPEPEIRLVAAGSILVSSGELVVDSTGASPTTHYPLPTDYWLEYGTQGMTPGNANNTLLHVTEETLLITGLAENTTYDFYARCDSAPDACYPRTARLKTSMLQSVPYCEDFNSFNTSQSTYMPGWRRESVSSANYPRLSSQGGRSLLFHVFGSEPTYTIIPWLDVDSLDGLTLSFGMMVENLDAGMVVGVTTDGLGIEGWTPLDTVRNTATGVWQRHAVSVEGNGFIVLRGIVDTADWRNIYVDNVSVETCHIPAGLHASLYSHNQILVGSGELVVDSTEGQTLPTTDYWVEYDTSGFEQGTGQWLHSSELPVLLTLDNLTSYDFYFRCDTVTPSCRVTQTVTTLAPPTAVPYCEAFDETTVNQLPEGWHTIGNAGSSTVGVNSGQHHSGARSLRLRANEQNSRYAILPDFTIASNQLTVSLWLRGSVGSTLAVGVMSDPNDVSTFIAVKEFVCENNWQHCLAPLDDAPTEGHFVALRYMSSTSAYANGYVDDLFVNDCGAADMRITSVESDYVVFDWDQTGEPLITIEWAEVGGEWSSISDQLTPPYTLSGLDRLTNYRFRFSATCNLPMGDDDWCNMYYEDSAARFTPSGGTGCIDPTNLTASYTTGFYGSFGNPYENTGIVDYGQTSALSRHTVHYDTAERDARTGGLLRTVPEGALASVRLGNWNTGTEGEALAYGLVVDTANFDLLILKYAAVLQDQMHPSSSQPRFKLEILDSAGTLLDDECGTADFIANQNLGWNLIPETFVLWKDWTTVGVDMSPYHGQTVTVRLTTFDCGDGAHYGYAYFTLNCMTKSMVSERCGEVADNRFSAPSGFAYNWYTNQSPTVFSTEQSVVVATNDSLTYYCDCSFVDKEQCYFTLSAYAGTRYPLAQFEYTTQVRNCRILVTFRNTSTISADGVTPIGTDEGCESAWWELDKSQDGMVRDTLTTYNATAVYDHAGTYTVRLVAGIAGGACTDTLEVPITLTMNTTPPSISGSTDICSGDTATLTVRDALRVDSSQWSVVSGQWPVDSTEGQVLPTVNYQLPTNSTTIYQLPTDTLSTLHSPLSSHVWSPTQTDVPTRCATR